MNICKRGSNRYSLILAFCFFLYAQFVCAQNSRLEKLNVGINFSINSNNEALHNYWKPGVLYEVYLKLPVGFGNVQTGLSCIPFKSKRTNQPDYNGYFLYIQWDKKIFTIDDFGLNTGIRFGLLRMTFEETSLYFTEDEMQEHEIFVGFASSLNYKLTNNIGIVLTFDYTSVLTKKKINLVFIGSGFYYAFDTPTWLKDFLK